MNKKTYASFGLGAGLVVGGVAGAALAVVDSKSPDSVHLDQVNDDETTTTPIEEPILPPETTVVTVLVSTPETSPPVSASIDATPDQDATLEQHEERLDTLEATTTTSTTTSTMPTTTVPPTTWRDG